jgi:hypothetical protein
VQNLKAAAFQVKLGENEPLGHKGFLNISLKD